MTKVDVNKAASIIGCYLKLEQPPHSTKTKAVHSCVTLQSPLELCGAVALWPGSPPKSGGPLIPLHHFETAPKAAPAAPPGMADGSLLDRSAAPPHLVAASLMVEPADSNPGCT